jgi:hypothetical protein
MVPDGYTNYPYVVSESSRATSLPLGSQIISFDRVTWLEECRARLDTHDEINRGEVIAALMGPAGGRDVPSRLDRPSNRTVGIVLETGAEAETATVAAGDRTEGVSGSYYQCQDYLDDYVARAREGVFQYPERNSEQYMLVPVTVLVPQRAIYSDGTPVE